MEQPNVTFMLVALIPKARTDACVWMGFMATGKVVTTTTSAFGNLATGIPNAKIQKAPTVVTVLPGFKGMESHVLILMSAKRVLMTVTRKPSASIPEARISVAV